MNISSQILKIYFYRILSLIVGFGSMLVVLPLISYDVSKYAIYAVTMSLCLFLTYGDFGFLSACQKYCAEAVGKNAISEESEYLGFTMVLLLVVFCLFSFLMVLASFYPQIIIPELEEKELRFASKMFLITGILMPIQVICQRLIFLILTTRLKDYIFSRVDIFANLLKIIIAPLFLRGDEFLLFEYFLTTILLSILSCLIGFLIVSYKNIFPLVEIFKNLRWNKNIFDKTKYLAASMMISTICWIMYYELDVLISAQFFSIEAVAFYSLAFTFLNFLRSLWVSGFSPFLPLMNVRIGEGDVFGAKKISSSMILFTTPLFIIIALFLGKHMEPIIVYWVGYEFIASANIAAVLLFGIALAGYSNVVAHYMTTFKLYRAILFFGVVPLLMYYGSFGLFMYFSPQGGILNLAYAKALSGMAASLMGLYLLVYHNAVAPGSVFRTLFFLALGVIGLFLMPSFFTLDSLSQETNIYSLLLVLISISVAIICIFVLSMMIFKPSRSLLIQLSNTIITTIKTKA